MEYETQYRPEQDDNKSNYTIKYLDGGEKTSRIAFECNRLNAEVAKFDEPLILGQGILEEPVTIEPGVGAYLDFTPFGNDDIHPKKITETYYRMYKGFETMVDVFGNDDKLPNIDFFYGDTNVRMARAMERFGFATYKSDNHDVVYYYARAVDVVGKIEEFKQNGFIDKIEKRMERDQSQQN